MIPMLTRLERELAQCADPLRRAELQAERASYLARTGHFAEANEILATLRKEYGDGRHARVSVWIMFVEGLILYFERVSADAHDRLLRAQAISSAADFSDLRLLTAAWLAHFEFERDKYEEMGRLLAAVIQHPSYSSPGIKARVAIVLGDAFSYIGNPAKSQMWFEFGRKCAVEAGDRATIGALMYNRSAFGLARMRVEHFANGCSLDLGQLRFLEMELNSSWAFQVGTNVVALTHLVQLSAARVLIFRDKFAESIEVLAPLREKLSLLEDRPNRSSVLAELSWCLLRSGNKQAAHEALREMNIIDVKRLDFDDRLVALSMAMTIADSLSDSSMFEQFKQELVHANSEYSIEMTRLTAILDSEVFSQLPISW